MIPTLALLSGRKKSYNSFYFKMLGMIASSVSFNLVEEFRNLRFKPDALPPLERTHLKLL